MTSGDLDFTILGHQWPGFCRKLSGQAMRLRIFRKLVFGVPLTITVLLIFLWNRSEPVRPFGAERKLQQLVESLPEVKAVVKISQQNQNLLPIRRVQHVNCAAIINGDQSAIKQAKEMMESPLFRRNKISDDEYINLTRNCFNFKTSRDYNLVPSPTEDSFPITYSILLYKEVEQAERLLRAIYSPSNYYCLHVDADAKPVVHQAIQSIADCFNNVFVVSKKEYVVYAGFTRLQADLNCMDNLLQRDKTWKYFINLPSQDFPLKTNAELVEILKTYNGANDIEGITGNRMLPHRFKYHYNYTIVNVNAKPNLVRTNIEKSPPPHNITVVKGSAYGVFSRAFVEFIHNSRVARDLLDWSRDVSSPDEYYWATLHHNPQIGTPGAYKGIPDDKQWLAVYVAWAPDKCAGKFVRGVCVFGIGDLHKLTKRPELFGNKFYLDFQPLALDCIEEWHLNRTAVRATDHFNATFYANLKFVQQHNAKNIK